MAINGSNTRPSFGDGRSDSCRSMHKPTGRNGRQSGRSPRKLGYSREALGLWIRHTEINSGARPGLTTDDRQRLAELERENVELRRAVLPITPSTYYRGQGQASDPTRHVNRHPKVPTKQHLKFPTWIITPPSQPISSMIRSLGWVSTLSRSSSRFS